MTALRLGLCGAAAASLAASVSAMQLTHLLDLSAQGGSALEVGRSVSPDEGSCAGKMEGRKYDLVMYGATGFTGKLSAQYVANNHPDNPTWAISGRTKSHLDELSSDLKKAHGAGPDVIVADLNDTASLQAMTSQAKVVLTFAGPYEKLGGEALIQAALASCTHYVDITGETPWKMNMIKAYNDEATAKGLAIVQSAGLDSLPSDIMAMLAAEAVAEDGKGAPDAVAVMWYRLNAWFSGGTMQSGLYSNLNHAPTKPYDLVPEGTVQVPTEDAVALFDEPHVAYMMQSVDVPTNLRSLSLRFPGHNISYSEDSSLELATSMASYLADPRMLSDPPPLNPKAGQGPPDWMLEDGSFSVKSRAKRNSDGKIVTVSMEGKGDPGYAACAKFSADFALALSSKGPAMTGFVTPSLAIGATNLRDTLEASDSGKLMHFSYSE